MTQLTGAPRSVVLIACCWVASLSSAPAQRPDRQAQPGAMNLPESNPYSSAADVEAGRRLYLGRCGHCHGQSGEGGRGNVLNTGRFHHGDSDRELFLVVRNGIPDTEMPGVVFSIPDIEVWRMVAYVRQLGRRGASEPVTGDATAGALVYQSQGCAVCHTIDGQGGFFGPDLTDIGAKRAVWHLRESIVSPNADIPLDYRSVAVTTPTGTSTSGIHLNEDEYSIHLRDISGIPRSFLKRELKEIKLTGASLMPAYPSISKEELENLVAYLSSLRPNRTGGAVAREPAETVVWIFDRVENIGGHRTTVLGGPRVIDSPVGKAVEFDGVDDALFIDHHPLAGAERFTWEAIFRPDGGATEQRWFHLSEQDPATGADTDNRMLFEIRVAGDRWFLDSYNQSGSASKALMNRKSLHPLGVWHHVASVYDGEEFRNYVDGVQEGAARLRLAPHGPGHASVGVRINKTFYFKGAVRLARFTRSALPPSEFLPAPGKS
jgi:putative heme-binding domain-containing protein